MGWLFLQLLPLVSNKHMISLSVDNEAHASHEGQVFWRLRNGEGGGDFSEVWLQITGSAIMWYDQEVDGIPIRRIRGTILVTQRTRVTATISHEWGRHRDTRQAMPQGDADDGKTGACNHHDLPQGRRRFACYPSPARIPEAGDHGTQLGASNPPPA